MCEVIDNTPLVCEEHNGFIYDPALRTLGRSKPEHPYYIVEQPVWELLQQYELKGPVITYVMSGGKITVKPGICQEHMEEAKIKLQEEGYKWKDGKLFINSSRNTNKSGNL